jgi:DNA-binding NarL/FixJ family response regulator
MRPSSRIRVLLAEGDSLVRQGLRRILEGQEWIQIVGEADNGRLAVEMLGQLQPDVLVLEVTQLLIDGVETTQRVSAQYPQTRVLAISVYRDGVHVGEMLRAGARGYLLKDDAQIDLVSAIRGVSLGLAFLSPDVIGVVLEDWRKAI